MKYPLVTIVILNWNDIEYTSACLESLKKIDYKNFRIILVDNGSKEEIYRNIKKRYSRFAKILRSRKNLGFTGGNNLGIRYAMDNDAEYVLLLNNDTEVEPDFLSKLVECMEKDESIGIIGPKIDFMDDKSLIWAIGGKFSLLTGNNKILWNKRKDTYKKFRLVDVDYVSGCAMMVRSSIFSSIGSLDDKYFLYSEEADFCYRTKTELGLRRVCRLDSKIYHKVSMSSSKITGLSAYYLTRNRLYFLKKHKSRAGYTLSLIYFFLFEIPKYIILYPMLYKNFRILKFFFMGISDFFKGRMGKKEFR